MAATPTAEDPVTMAAIASSPWEEARSAAKHRRVRAESLPNMESKRPKDAHRHVSFALEHNQCHYFTPPTSRRRKSHKKAGPAPEPVLKAVPTRFEGSGWAVPDDDRPPREPTPPPPSPLHDSNGTESKKKRRSHHKNGRPSRRGAGTESPGATTPEATPPATDDDEEEVEGAPAAELVCETQQDAGSVSILVRAASGAAEGVLDTLETRFRPDMVALAAGSWSWGLLFACDVKMETGQIQREGRTARITLLKQQSGMWPSVGSELPLPRVALLMGSPAPPRGAAGPGARRRLFVSEEATEPKSAPLALAEKLAMASSGDAGSTSGGSHGWSVFAFLLSVVVTCILFGRTLLLF